VEEIFHCALRGQRAAVATASRSRFAYHDRVRPALDAEPPERDGASPRTALLERPRLSAIRRLPIALLLLSVCLAPARASTRGCEILAVVGLADEAAVAAGPGVQVVISAADARLLRERLGRVDVRGLAAVVSFGIAGGLDDELEEGDLLVATRVVSGEDSWPVDRGMLSAFRSAMAGPEALDFAEATFLGRDRVIDSDAEANRALRRRSGADSVDNESHIAAEFADHNGLPFAAIRAISDSADHELPPAALVPLRPDGRGDWKGVLGSLVRQPSQLPALVETVKGFRAALETLRAVRERLDLADLAPQRNPSACVGDD
jgi:adenosylhomocysteine nucleosidase